MSFLPPAHITFHLTFWIESPTFNQAFGKAEGHGGIIGPFAGLEMERAASHHVGDGCECSGRLEFKRSPQGIPNRQAGETSEIAIQYVVDVTILGVPSIQRLP